MALLLRLAVADDHPTWEHLRCQLWPDCPVARHQLEVRQLLSSGGQVVLAYIDKEPVGFAEVSIRSDHVEGAQTAPLPYLEGWYVAPPHRSQGVGRALIAAVEQWAHSKGYRELASDAEIENEKSIRLHSLLGFREVGRTAHFMRSLP